LELIESVRIGRAGLRNSNPVIGESRVQIGRLNFGHVAGHTTLRGYRAWRAWAIRGFLLRGSCYMAFEAGCIIRIRVVHQGFMRVVTSNTGEAAVSFCPAPAVFKAIGSEPHVKHACAC